MLSHFPLSWAVIGIGAAIFCHLPGVEAFIPVLCHSQSSRVAAMGSVRKNHCRIILLKWFACVFYCTFKTAVAL